MKATRKCSVESCDTPVGHHGAHNMCSIHYDRVRLHGTTEPPHIPSPAERLAAGLERKPNGCLEWTGDRSHKLEYGRIKVNGKTVMTHRFAWELVNGPIPDGLHVLHHCDNPPCCQTDPTEGYPEGHLFIGTRSDNMADKIAKGRDYWLNVTHCPQNHPYDEANTYVTPRGHRQCRTCRREVMARYWKEHPRVEAS